MNADRKLLGLVVHDESALLQNEPGLELVVTASDIMRPAVSVDVKDDMRTVFERMRNEGLRELPVVDEAGVVIGLVDEGDVAQVYLKATSGA